MVLSQVVPPCPFLTVSTILFFLSVSFQIMDSSGDMTVVDMKDIGYLV